MTKKLNKKLKKLAKLDEHRILALEIEGTWADSRSIGFALSVVFDKVGFRKIRFLQTTEGAFLHQVVDSDSGKDEELTVDMYMTMFRHMLKSSKEMKATPGPNEG